MTDLRSCLFSIEEKVCHHVLSFRHVDGGHYIDESPVQPIGEAVAVDDHRPVELARFYRVICVGGRGFDIEKGREAGGWVG